VKKLLLLLLAIGLVALLAYTLRFSILREIGAFLVVSDRLEPADLIYVLNGDVSARPRHAATLFQRGLAPNIAMARAEDSLAVRAGAYPNVTDTSIAVLKSQGVPGERIVELRPDGGVQHTFDEAEVLRSYCREHSLHKIIIVTSDLHSRRARFIFRKVLSGLPVKIMLAPTPDVKYGAANWWRSEDGVIGCQNEYVKLIYYHLRY